MNIVISDTSPISDLIRLNLLELLPKLYGELIIPPTVYAELLNLSVFGPRIGVSASNGSKAKRTYSLHQTFINRTSKTRI